jgi:hypothetical protein
MRTASVSQRLRSTLVDAAVVLAGMGAFAVCVIGGIVALTRPRRVTGQRAPEPPAPTRPSSSPSGRPQPSPTQRFSTWEPGARGAATGLRVAARNWRSPGHRLSGLRRVDARTGGPVSVHSALAGVLYDQTSRALVQVLFGSPAQRQRSRVRALEPELQAIRREHAGDAEALKRATFELYKANRINALDGCGWQLVGIGVSIGIDVLGGRGGQTLRDRVTRTAVILVRDSDV